ncbi:hypothetical protein PAXRUDRAFT_276474 [Paxillus rubicundulus Ve08.2h10]|uniref:Uncharacterized protein n=1 Tax=Paxillus rubicundulus Ve08.2h10 TaxID=930991 RepID=A0A0D0DEZ3_9AGAM|nr:hypothetical protein PAXRUDRAFT_276474 [Paxillus rubicundulus Ve08.2h10]
MGYFAFPPTSNSSSSAQPVDMGLAEAWFPYDTSSGQSRARSVEEEDGGKAEQQTDEERLRRLERERELGESSEIEWVRAGGVLRDAFGRRDKARTESIRVELKLQEQERRKMERWESYEGGWRRVNASTEPLVFADFPWPLPDRIMDRDLSRLDRQSVTDFLFESLSVRSNTTTTKERIRSSLLRWHPDKMSRVLNRVIPDDEELVREGIHVVFGTLKALQDAERTGQSVI